MLHRFCLILIIVPLAYLSQAQTPVKLIVDTDFDSAIDDVGALALLHTLANRGEAELLAVVNSGMFEASPACIDAINTFYGRGNIPVGQPQKSGVLKHSVYAEYIADNYDYDLPKPEESVSLYRRILAQQPDTSVVLLTLGYHTNIARLLTSTADEFSPLNGFDLVKKKVKYWVSMNSLGSAWNLKWDMYASAVAINQWPLPMYISNEGYNIKTDGLKYTPEGPVRSAYQQWVNKNPTDAEGQPSWDQIAALFAVRGLGKFFEIEQKGTLEFSNGVASFEENKTDGTDYIIRSTISDEEMVILLQELMLGNNAN